MKRKPANKNKCYEDFSNDPGTPTSSSALLADEDGIPDTLRFSSYACILKMLGKRLALSPKGESEWSIGITGNGRPGPVLPEAARRQTNKANQAIADFLSSLPRFKSRTLHMTSARTARLHSQYHN